MTLAVTATLNPKRETGILLWYTYGVQVQSRNNAHDSRKNSVREYLRLVIINKKRLVCNQSCLSLAAEFFNDVSKNRRFKMAGRRSCSYACSSAQKESQSHVCRKRPERHSCQKVDGRRMTQITCADETICTVQPCIQHTHLSAMGFSQRALLSEWNASGPTSPTVLAFKERVISVRLHRTAKSDFSTRANESDGMTSHKKAQAQAPHTYLFCSDQIAHLS